MNRNWAENQQTEMYTFAILYLVFVNRINYINRKIPI